MAYRLTGVSVNPDPNEKTKAEPLYVDYRLPMFEAIRFEDALAERGFIIYERKAIEPKESEHQGHAKEGKVKQAELAPPLSETERKVVGYVLVGMALAVGSVAAWSVNSALRMFRWLVTKKPDIRMADPLPARGLEPISPFDSVAFTTHPNLGEPLVRRVGGTSEGLDHSIKGGAQPIIALTLKPGEAIIAETGSLLVKDDAVSMKRVSGSTEGYSPDAFGIVKRWLMGESFWFLKYRNETEQEGKLVLSPSKVGTMLCLNLAKFADGLVADGGSFFAAGRGVKLATSRLLSIGGWLSGLGPFQQRFTGNGEVFLFSSGEVHEVDVKRGKPLLLDPDAVFAWEPTVSVKPKWLGLWSGIVSGEGFFLCKVSGEGRLFYASRGMSDDPAKDRTGGPTGTVARHLDKLF